jgi:hypothetical protein
MLRKRGRLSKSIEERMWWKLWEYAGMASARFWRGFWAYIVARPKRQRPPDQQLVDNRPFLFRKDLVFCVQFVIYCRLMSLADWAKLCGGMVGLSGSSRVCCSLPHFVSRLRSTLTLSSFDDPHHPRPLNPARGHAPHAFSRQTLHLLGVSPLSYSHTQMICSRSSSAPRSTSSLLTRRTFVHPPPIRR